MKEPKEVFRGHLEECLQHFVVVFSNKWPKNGKGTDKAKKPIADFCGVSTNSVTRWFHTGKLPFGTAKIRLMCYLDMMGYKVLEIERMPKDRKNFFELIGYSMLSIDEAAKLVGYSEPSTLYQVLFGSHDPNNERAQKMWDCWKSKKDELLKRKQESHEKYRLNPTQKIRPAVVKVGTMSNVAKKPAVLIVMEGLLGLLEDDSLGKLQPHEMDSLRQSSDTVLALNARLSAFSSHLFARNSGTKDG